MNADDCVAFVLPVIVIINCVATVTAGIANISRE